jgi:hypothetical protein
MDRFTKLGPTNFMINAIAKLHSELIADWRKLIRSTCAEVVSLLRTDLTPNKLSPNNSFNSRLPRNAAIRRT